MLKGSDVAAHNSADSLWMIIHGKVYDLTDFAPSHPGGIKILLKYAGKDATEEYDPIHPPGTIEQTLSADKHLGPIDMSTLEDGQKMVEVATPSSSSTAVAALSGVPSSASACLNLDDFEKAAEALLKPKAWAYYRSAADDERTFSWNRDAFSLIRFRPRVLRNVLPVDLSTSILGHRSRMPIYISPAAMGRLAHPEGEKCLVRTAASHGIPYVVSANSSVSFEDIAAEVPKDTILFYQLYVNRDRSKSEDILRRVARAGYKAICVTVDAPVAGKRERDERTKLDDDAAADLSTSAAVKRTGPDAPDAPQDEKSQGIAQGLGSYVDPTLSWTDLAWVRRASGGLPIIVKGIQSAEDAALAAYYGAAAIVLSNHGSRQLEGAPSSLETLLEIRKFEPDMFDKVEVWCDGGYRRGTDVLKAIALGAKCVGFGRPFMYSLAFGDQGAERVATILREELEQNTRLLGATKLGEVVPAMVNTTELERNLYNGPYDSPIKTILAKL
ncbi:hypothetical protein RHOSPDRAFT_28145 [Rhodotorula sp. JG-1b]|nr:hypothetical protein RHOSPDRAFT_28145 [Rhodotorula sp. JG-1b]